MFPELQHHLNHRTIRAWEQRPLSDSVREALLEVASHTSTSNGMQMASIIRVTDPGIRATLAEIGAQSYMATAPELWIFVVDGARNARLFEEAGMEAHTPVTADGFFQGFTDACLMAQNVANAAEALGLGIGLYGNIHNDDAAVIEALGLPRHTFPVLGIGIGYPGQDPMLKPRIPTELRVSENRYEAPASWSEALREYDDDMAAYYDLRDPSRTVGRFTDQVRARQAGPVRKRDDMTKVARAQGFAL